MAKVGEPLRQTLTQTTTTVRQIMGPEFNHNPPSLGQLRAFVAACDGLADGVQVTIDKGSLNEAGRYDYVFSVRIVEDNGVGRVTTDED